MIVRAAQRLMGTALAMAALGLWFGPGASWEADVMLFKLILSVTAALAAIGLLLASSAPKPPEVEFDLIRREVRLMRNAGRRNAVILQRCAFADLSGVEWDGPHLRLWDAERRLLAEAMIDDRSALGSLINALRDAGKGV